jgi:hypothetical protein
MIGFKRIEVFLLQNEDAEKEDMSNIKRDTKEIKLKTDGRSISKRQRRRPCRYDSSMSSPHGTRPIDDRRVSIE